MKLTFRLLIFWVFSLFLGGAYAGVSGLDAFSDATYTVAEVR